MINIVSLVLLSQCLTRIQLVEAFGVGSQRNTQYYHHGGHPLQASPRDQISEAELLLKRAREIRETLPKSEARPSPERHSKYNGSSVWRVNSVSEGFGYRLQIDIGREEGTWMDPRWGASGRRMELTLDVLFSKYPCDEKARSKMVKDNITGKSSGVFSLDTSPQARMRNGFDKMACDGGAYRVDFGGKGQTVRFYVNVEGTQDKGSYGDIFIPMGCLYFSIPCFGGASQISSKEGIVTIRQTGWHTGWRREESRIVGTFRAVPIDQAIKKDGF